MSKLCIARPTGYSLECPDIGSWMFRLAFRIRTRFKIEVDIYDPPGCELFQVANPRVRMMRNLCVQHARETQSDYLMMVDPDMVCDAYVEVSRDGKVLPGSPPFFWDAAFPFLLHHQKRLGPCVLGVPYCGRLPHQPVHVFCENKTSKLVRLTRDLAKQQSGWRQVAAVGTGCVLMPMSVFERLDEPYFKDVYTDRSETKLRFSQDVDFCLRCKGAGIPIYVNFSCWAKHWQNTPVEAPGHDTPPPKEEPISLATNPAVPVLVEDGPGDRSW